MKHFTQNLLFAFCFLTSISGYGQTEMVDTAAFRRIRQAELQGSHIAEIARYLTDVSGPRLTNSPGFKRAADWSVQKMKSWGLVNAKLEPWGQFGKQWEIQDFSISMKLPYNQPLTAFPIPWNSNTKGLQQGKVVLITGKNMGDTTYLEQHLADFKGKIILITGESRPSSEIFKPTAERLSDSALINIGDTFMTPRSEIEKFLASFEINHKIDALLKKSGAIAAISASGWSVNGTVFVQANSGFKMTSTATIPILEMAFEDGQKIKQLIEAGKNVELAVNVKGKFSTDDTNGYNVIAEIPGTDPTLKSEIVMLGGHLDSWDAATGATDNAAGCAVMMEAIRLLDSLDLRPKRTIRIALWSGEEQGLLGSYGYVKNHFIDAATFNLKPEQAKVSAYFNLDNGTGKIRGIFAQGNPAVKPIFEQWFVPFHDLDAKTVTLKNTGSTDHISFDWAGIPAFQFIQDPIDYETRTHHSNMDSYEHLQIDDLKQAAIIVASFVYQASVRSEKLPRKELVKEKFVFEGF